MEVKASARYLRISPRKLRLLTRDLTGLSPAKALVKLEQYPQRGREFLQKVIKQAKANAINNFKLGEENLRIKKIEVGDGPAYKRMDKSHGARFDRGIIKKRTAHLFLTLEAIQKAEEKATPVARRDKKKPVVKPKIEPKTPAVKKGKGNRKLKGRKLKSKLKVE